MRTTTFVLITASLLVLGCSTPTLEPVAAEAVVQVPPPEFTRELPLEPAVKPPFHTCKLGTSCLTMDERPFETCLVSGGTKHCVDKALEPVEVLTPKSLADPGVIETVARDAD